MTDKGPEMESNNPPPDSVLRWLTASGAADRQIPHTVRLRQKGELRLDPANPWLPFEARQHFTTDSPSFEWVARVSMFGLPLMRVRDSLNDGVAQMRGMLAGIFPLVNARGPELDQGALLRYLGEISWFPMAARRPFIRWQEVDSRTAKAELTWGAVSVSSAWEFNERGLPARFSAKRYAARGKGFELLDWWVIYTGYAQFQGVTVGSKCEVHWRYPEGDFCWLRLEITELEYL